MTDELPKTSPARPPRDNIVRAVPSIEVRAVDGSLGTLAGHFSKFNTWYEVDSLWEGHFLERIAPGSFKKTFRENRDAIRVTFNHGADPQLGDKVLGPIERLEEDEEGPYYEVPLLDTSYNRDLLPGLRAGLYGASFRFRVTREEFEQRPKPSEWNPDGIPERTVKEVQVMEFGPVTYPANPAATAGVRSLTDAYALGQFIREPERFAELINSMRATSAPSDDGAEAEPHPVEERREEPPAPPPVVAAPTTPKDPATAGSSVSRKKGPTSVDLEKYRTIEELEARDAEVRGLISDLDNEYAGRSFPADVKATWDGYISERAAIGELVTELRARKATVERLAAKDETQPADKPRWTVPGDGPQVARRKTDDIWDVSAIRGIARSEAEERQLFRDNALRAVEISQFAHPSVQREKAQEHIAKLLDRGLSQDDTGRPQFDAKEVARRILVTGSPAYRRAFAKYVANGARSPEIERALSLGSTGVPVPYVLDPTLIPVSNGAVNPFRAACRVVQITVDEWRGTTSAGITAAYAAEATASSDNSPTLAQPTISTEKAQAFVPFSIELGMDWSSIESDLARDLGDAKDELEASKFATGSGTNEPAGLITGATNTITAGGVASFAVADVYKLEEGVPARYRPRSVVFGNRFTYNKVRQFDTGGGASLWIYLAAGLNNQPNGGNTGAQLIGYPAYESSAMASALTTGSKILAMGDPQRFVIVDRIGLEIEFIPHLFDTTNNRPTGQRGLYAYWRNGSKVVDANAFRVLVTG